VLSVKTQTVYGDPEQSFLTGPGTYHKFLELVICKVKL
jgi:hypothetical protein